MFSCRKPSSVAQSLFSFLIALFFVFSTHTLALAAPGDSDTGWINLSANVPDGFRGSVSVLLENTESGETHIVSCYFPSNYKNNFQIPLGQYVVVSAFTSEDSFVYEAFTETETFELTGGQDIEVAVVYNEEGAGFLESLKNNPPEAFESERETAPPSGEDTATPDSETPKPESPIEDPSTESEALDEAPTSVPESEEEGAPAPESETGETKSLASRILSGLLSLFATAVFVGLIALIVYIYRQRLADD